MDIFLNVNTKCISRTATTRFFVLLVLSSRYSYIRNNYYKQLYLMIGMTTAMIKWKKRLKYIKNLILLEYRRMYDNYFNK